MKKEMNIFDSLCLFKKHRGARGFITSLEGMGDIQKVFLYHDKEVIFNEDTGTWHIICGSGACDTGLTREDLEGVVDFDGEYKTYYTRRVSELSDGEFEILIAQALPSDTEYVVSCILDNAGVCGYDIIRNGDGWVIKFDDSSWKEYQVEALLHFSESFEVIKKVPADNS